MTMTRQFPLALTSVRAARTYALGVLPDLPSATKESIAIMVSELATNAVLHATSSFKLTVDQTGSRIRIAASDTGGGSPRVQSPNKLEPHGRGLRIIEALSDDWGVTEAEGQPGKVVWFTVDVALSDNS